MHSRQLERTVFQHLQVQRMLDIYCTLCLEDYRDFEQENIWIDQRAGNGMISFSPLGHWFETKLVGNKGSYYYPKALAFIN